MIATSVCTSCDDHNKYGGIPIEVTNSKEWHDMTWHDMTTIRKTEIRTRTTTTKTTPTPKTRFINHAKYLQLRPTTRSCSWTERCAALHCAQSSTRLVPDRHIVNDPLQQWRWRWRWRWRFQNETKQQQQHQGSRTGACDRFGKQDCN